jgi:DNA transformation protein
MRQGCKNNLEHPEGAGLSFKTQAGPFFLPILVLCHKKGDWIVALSNEFIDFLLDQLSAWGDVTVRKMFGGAGLYCEGLMFGLIADDVIYLKVDDSNRKSFEDVGSTPFKPFPDKKTVMSYYELPPDVLEDPEELAEWAERSLDIQRKKNA